MKKKSLNIAALNSYNMAKTGFIPSILNLFLL